MTHLLTRDDHLCDHLTHRLMNQFHSLSLSLSVPSTRSPSLHPIASFYLCIHASHLFGKSVCISDLSSPLSLSLEQSNIIHIRSINPYISLVVRDVLSFSFFNFIRQHLITSTHTYMSANSSHKSLSIFTFSILVDCCHVFLHPLSRTCIVGSPLVVFRVLLEIIDINFYHL